MKRPRSHLPNVHGGGKNVVNGNPHTLFLYLFPFLLPEQWEEPTGRSFHSALTVVILEEMGREREWECGREGETCGYGQKQGEREIEEQRERDASMEPFYPFFNKINGFRGNNTSNVALMLIQLYLYVN